jgi:hypothetical protein
VVRHGLPLRKCGEKGEDVAASIGVSEPAEAPLRNRPKRLRQQKAEIRKFFGRPWWLCKMKSRNQSEGRRIREEKVIGRQEDDLRKSIDVLAPL